MSSADATLPILRQDIRLHRVNAEHGKPRFLVHDPLAHRYFTLSRRSIEILKHWPKLPTSPDVLRNALGANNVTPPDDAELKSLIYFLRTANLLVARENTREALKKQARTKKNILHSVTNILFLKLPILQPAHFIEWVYPIVRPLFSRPFSILCAVLAMISFAMLIKQPEVISEHFRGLLTFNGGLAFLGTMVFVKIVHEFGHAFQAYQHGAAVPRIGIMLMFGFPLPYTELSDVWKLKRRRSRLYVDLGGILAELALASWASVVFFILPDGLAKNAAFLVALASVLMSLAVNLNPLMRFDGYYIISDYFRIPNLQSRSNAMVKCRLRRVLFNDPMPAPESWAPKVQRNLALFGAMIWIYQFFLYLGFAILAYNLAFKALGIFLFFVEIYIFILRPISLELKHWWKNKGTYMKQTRTYVSAVIFLILLGLAFGRRKASSNRPPAWRKRKLRSCLRLKTG